MRKVFRMQGFLAMLSVAAAVSCASGDPDDGGKPETAEVFAKGADISWLTEMEAEGYPFFDASGARKECTALMKELGFNAVRYRVWVNPAEGYCNKEDVLEKAKRAQALGLKIMIDFHYSDTWADPGRQTVPEAWKGHPVDQLAIDVAGHTAEVLDLLKQHSIDVAWVQVGNETRSGFLWETCKVSGQDCRNFVKVFNAGCAAAKSVYPDVKVIMHIDNGWDEQLTNWYFNLMSIGKAEYDIIGLSLYPSSWDDRTKSYPDWSTKVKQLVSNAAKLDKSFSKPVMICEFGMPASEPTKAREALKYLMDNTRNLGYVKGIFLWEPESEHSRNGYDYGAFSDGKATIALDPIKN